MKQATIIIDHDELEDLLREHLAGMFPTLKVESIFGLGYGDVTVRLRKPPTYDEPAPTEPLGGAGVRANAVLRSAST